MEIEGDIVFASIGGRELCADIYRPGGGEVPTRTAVILIHGGGWVHGERAMMAPLAAGFAQQGYLAVSVDYRLAQEANWPAQRDDIAAAVRWTAANAGRLGIDAGRIVVLGCSAGGQLAMTAAALPEQPGIAAVIALFTPDELTLGGGAAKGTLDGSALLGAGASEAERAAASPLLQIQPGYPPVLLLHGGEDWLVDPIASLRLYEKLAGLGVPVDLHILAGAHHEFSSESGMVEPVVSIANLFLQRMLLEPERWSESAQASNIFACGPEAVSAMMARMAGSEH